MIRTFISGMLAFGAIFAVSALAVAEETVIEHRTVETEQKAVEVVPEVKERVVEERTVTQKPPVVQKRTDTVVTTGDDDNDDDDDNDND